MSKIIRLPRVLEATGLSRTTIWRLESRGDFPRRRRLGPQAVGWLLHEVEEWIATRAPVKPARGSASATRARRPSRPVASIGSNAEQP